MDLLTIIGMRQFNDVNACCTYLLVTQRIHSQIDSERWHLLDAGLRWRRLEGGTLWFRAESGPDQLLFYYGGVYRGIGLDQAVYVEFRCICVISGMWRFILMIVRAGAINVFFSELLLLLVTQFECWMFPCRLFKVLVAWYVSPVVLLFSWVGRVVSMWLHPRWEL